jgi:hypothetical protein
MSPFSSTRLMRAICLSGMACLPGEPAWADTPPRYAEAVAAVIRHFASGFASLRASPTYVAYYGKTPPASLWELVSDVRGIQPMPTSWKPGSDDNLTELFDVVDVRRVTPDRVEIGTQVVGPVGIAVEGCTYVAEHRGNSWQVDAEATRCLVL